MSAKASAQFKQVLPCALTESMGGVEHFDVWHRLLSDCAASPVDVHLYCSNIPRGTIQIYVKVKITEVCLYYT